MRVRVILEILLGRYLGNIPLMIFGIISVVVGNWFLNTSKHIVNSVLAMSVIIFIIGLVARTSCGDSDFE